MSNFLDNIDIIDANNHITNVSLQDRNSLALATQALAQIERLSQLDIVTPQMYGALADGVHDDTEAIQTAINSGNLVYFPNGTYLITDELTLIQGSHLVGCQGNGIGAVIKNNSIKNTITVPNYVTPIIENLYLKKEGSYKGTGTGVSIELTDNYIIKNVRVDSHYVGILINGTSFGFVDRCWAVGNANDGFQFRNNDTLITCQVQISNCYTQYNGRHGYCFLSFRDGMQTGQFTGNMSFANGGAGVFITGDSGTHTVSGLRMNDCFLGADYLGGLYIGGTSLPVTIANSVLEAAGMSNCGVDGLIPAPNTGHNITVLSDAVRVVNCTILSSAQSGIQFTTKGNIITNCTFGSCGLGTGVDDLQKSGITAIESGIIENCKFDAMTYGVYNYTDQPLNILGNIFSNTISTPIGNVLSNVNIKNNIGVSDN